MKRPSPPTEIFKTKYTTSITTRQQWNYVIKRTILADRWIILKHHMRRIVSFMIIYILVEQTTLSETILNTARSSTELACHHHRQTLFLSFICYLLNFSVPRGFFGRFGTVPFSLLNNLFGFNVTPLLLTRLKKTIFKHWI